MILQFPFPQHGGNYLIRREPGKLLMLPPPMPEITLGPAELRIMLADIPFTTADGRFRNGPDGAA